MLVIDHLPSQGYRREIPPGFRAFFLQAGMRAPLYQKEYIEGLFPFRYQIDFQAHRAEVLKQVIHDPCSVDLGITSTAIPKADGKHGL